MTRVVSIPAVVVLPAPLGPSRPKISPCRTVRLRWSTAKKSVPAYCLVRSTVRMMSPGEPPPAAGAAGTVSAGCVDTDIGVLQSAVDGFDGGAQRRLVGRGEVAGEALVHAGGHILELGPAGLARRRQRDAQDPPVDLVPLSLDEALGAEAVEVAGDRRA